MGADPVTRPRQAFDLERWSWTLHVMLGEFPAAGLALGDTLDACDRQRFGGANPALPGGDDVG